MSPLNIFSSMTVQKFHPECLFFRVMYSLNYLSLSCSFTTESRVWVPSLPQRAKPKTLTGMKGAYVRKWKLWKRKPIKVCVINVAILWEIGAWSYSDLLNCLSPPREKTGASIYQLPNWLKPALILAYRENIPGAYVQISHNWQRSLGKKARDNSSAKMEHIQVATIKSWLPHWELE